MHPHVTATQPPRNEHCSCARTTEMDFIYTYTYMYTYIHTHTGNDYSTPAKRAC